MRQLGLKGQLGMRACNRIHTQAEAYARLCSVAADVAASVQVSQAVR